MTTISLIAVLFLLISLPVLRAQQVCNIPPENIWPTIDQVEGWTVPVNAPSGIYQPFPKEKADKLILFIKNKLPMKFTLLPRIQGYESLLWYSASREDITVYLNATRDRPTKYNWTFMLPQ